MANYKYLIYPLSPESVYLFNDCLCYCVTGSDAHDLWGLPRVQALRPKVPRIVRKVIIEKPNALRNDIECQFRDALRHPVWHR